MAERAKCNLFNAVNQETPPCLPEPLRFILPVRLRLCFGGCGTRNNRFHKIFENLNVFCFIIEIYSAFGEMCAWRIGGGRISPIIILS